MSDPVSDTGPDTGPDTRFSQLPNPTYSWVVADLLTTRALNRATLARQMLLRRVALRPHEALERLVGLQAQSPPAPYVGLWTRLETFDPEDLSRLILSRRAVRIALMRSTIHLVSARDALAIRPLVQPVIVRATYGGHGRLLAGLDDDVLAKAGKRLLEEEPLTLMEIGARLKKRWPDRDPSSLAMAIRAHVPLVQVPPRGLWKRSGGAKHTSADAWIGRPLAVHPNAAKLLRRYLAAFGPASVRDAQAWSGIAFGDVAKGLRSKLRVFKDERGRELLDSPDALRPDPDEPAPPRFLPEFDNVLLSFDVRSRIVSDTHRPILFSRNGVIASTLLVDGFVRGTCVIARSTKGTVMTITLFERLSGRDRLTVEAEGHRLLAFTAAGCEPFDIRFAK